MCTVSIRQKCTFLAKHNKVWTTIISRCFQGAPATRCRSYNKTRQLPVYIDQHWTLMTPTFSTEHSSRSSTSSLTPVLCLLPSLPSSLLHYSPARCTTPGLSCHPEHSANSKLHSEKHRPRVAQCSKDNCVEMFLLVLLNRLLEQMNVKKNKT